MGILLLFLSSVAILAISPGPDNIFVLTQSMVNGKKYGLATVAGLMTGCVIHTSLVAFGVSEIIKQNENLFFTIKLLGAGYLLYLAYQVFKSDSSITFSKDKVYEKSMAELFKKGFLMNVLNPKVTIFFLALFPQFLFSKELPNLVQFYILGGLFIVVSGFIFSFIAIVAGKIADYIKNNNKIGLFFKWMQVIAFVLIAVMILM